MINTPDLFELKNKLETLKQEVIVLFSKLHTETKIEKKSKEDGSIITNIDMAINTFLQNELGKILPQAAWLSEESADQIDRLKSKWVWIVDPLDGTRELVRGINEFAVSIGLVYDGEPVLGMVFNPFTLESGVGIVGKGTWFSKESTSLEPTSLSMARITVSRSEAESGHLQSYSQKIPNLIPMGSVAYKLLRVAAGWDNLTFTIKPKNEWDICGGIAILKAARKAHFAFDGRKLLFNQSNICIRCGLVAGSRCLINEFQKLRETMEDCL